MTRVGKRVAVKVCIFPKSAISFQSRNNSWAVGDGRCQLLPEASSAAAPSSPPARSPPARCSPPASVTRGCADREPSPAPASPLQQSEQPQGDGAVRRGVRPPLRGEAGWCRAHADRREVSTIAGAAAIPRCWARAGCCLGNGHGTS